MEQKIINNNIKKINEQNCYFYFAKPINEIIQQTKSKVNYLFYDYLFYDDVEEVMRRYYSKEESDIRLTNYTEYYASLIIPYFGNFSKTNVNKIMCKREYKYYKIQKDLNEKDIDNNDEDDIINKSKTLFFKQDVKLLKNINNESEYLEDIENTDTINIKNDENSNSECYLKCENNFENFNFECNYYDIFNPEITSRSISKYTNSYQNSLKSEEININFSDIKNKKDFFYDNNNLEKILESNNYSQITLTNNINDSLNLKKSNIIDINQPPSCKLIKNNIVNFKKVKNIKKKNSKIKSSKTKTTKIAIKQKIMDNSNTKKSIAKYKLKNAKHLKKNIKKNDFKYLKQKTIESNKSKVNKIKGNNNNKLNINIENFKTLNSNCINTNKIGNIKKNCSNSKSSYKSFYYNDINPKTLKCKTDRDINNLLLSKKIFIKNKSKAKKNSKQKLKNQLVHKNINRITTSLKKFIKSVTKKKSKNKKYNNIYQLTKSPKKIQKNKINSDDKLIKNYLSSNNNCSKKENILKYLKSNKNSDIKIFNKDKLFKNKFSKNVLFSTSNMNKINLKNNHLIGLFSSQILNSKLNNFII